MFNEDEFVLTSKKNNDHATTLAQSQSVIPNPLPALPPKLLITREPEQPLKPGIIKTMLVKNDPTQIFSLNFEMLFGNLSSLKSAAIHGQLENTNMRFLAWMIFLECIPINRVEWIDAINRNRLDYERIKNEICLDPHLNLGNNCFDHPLSQDNSSVWNKFYENNDLKSVIFQDVIRM